jgi:hypothetical protein
VMTYKPRNAFPDDILKISFVATQIVRREGEGVG